MFQPGHEGMGGRPAGKRTTCKVPVAIQRKLVRQLAERADQGDIHAQDNLALIVIAQQAAP